MSVVMRKAARRYSYRLIPALLVFCLVASTGSATVYLVGPGEKYAKVSDVAPKLRYGDVVEITGDITDTVTLTAHGTAEKPIVIRGVTRIEDGHIVRPCITATPAAGKIIICKGDWNVLEGLDISGQADITFRQGAIVQECDNLVIRNCRIHHCLRAFYGDEDLAGDVRFEFCEFYANGYAEKPPVSLYSNRPGATAVVEHCFFLDGTGGNMLRICTPRSVVRYNWFENPYEHALQVSTPPVDGDDKAKAIGDTILPAHCDIVGNVVVFGWGPGSPYCAFSLGGDSPEAPGTEGDFNIAHNLVLTRRGGATPQVAVLVHGNVDRVNIFNNVFLEGGVRGLVVYSRENVWEGYRRQRFIASRGSGEPVVSGANNWVSQYGTGVPGALQGTLRGVNPLFMNLVGCDFRPQPDSPLAAGGMWPLPKGQVCDLAPEYEPRRGIPSDLKTIPRRKVPIASIGPFEASEIPPPFDDDSADLVLRVKESGGRFAWPFDFGAHRRESLRALANGDHAMALSHAYMEFVCCPTDEETLARCISHVGDVLRAMDGNGVRADRFQAFAAYGAAGRGGLRETDDDLENPLRSTEILKSLSAEGKYKAFDRKLIELSRLGEDVATVMRGYELGWYSTEKAFARLENLDLYAAMELMMPALASAARQPFGDVDGKRTWQRNQSVIDRVLAGLTVVSRAQSGTAYGADAFAKRHLEFAVYGPAGADGRIGTGDDIDVRSPHSAGHLAVTRHDALAGDHRLLDAAALNEFVLIRLHRERENTAEIESRVLFRFGLICDPHMAGYLRIFQSDCPTPAEFLHRALDVTGSQEYQRSASTPVMSSEATQLERRFLREADMSLMERYARLREDLSLEKADTCRAYLTAFLLSTHDKSTYDLAITVFNELSPGEPVTILAEDALRQLDAPFAAGAILDCCIQHGEALGTAEDVARLDDAIGLAQYAHIKRDLDALKGEVDEGTRAALFKDAARKCDLFAARYPSSDRLPSVRFQKTFCLYHTSRFQEVIAAADEFLRVYPRSVLVAEMAFLRCMAMLDSGRIEHGRSELERFVRIHAEDPLAAKALYALAKLAIAKQEYGEAKGHLLRLSDFYPDHTLAGTAAAMLENIESIEAQFHLGQGE